MNESECKVAVMDLGTQTFRLAAGQVHDGKAEILLSLRRNVRMGRSLKETGSFSPQAIEAGIKVIREYKDILARYSINHYGAYATEAFRRAANSADFLKKAQGVGVPIEILSPEEEATVAARGAYLTVADLKGHWLMLDSGGGSTEIVLSVGQDVLDWLSMPVGAVVLFEECGRKDRQDPEEVLKLAASHIDRRLGPVKGRFQKATRLVATGGTATTVAAVILGLSIYDPKKVRGFTVSEDELAKLFYQVAEMDLDTRRSLTGLEPERADIFPAGIAILLEIIRYLGLKKIIISDGGILLGLLAASIEKECKFYVEPSCARGLYI